jgi:hypothetical protein
MPDPLIMLIGGAIVAAFALGLGMGSWVGAKTLKPKREYQPEQWRGE